MTKRIITTAFVFLVSSLTIFGQTDSVITAINKLFKKGSYLSFCQNATVRVVNDTLVIHSAYLNPLECDTTFAWNFTSNNHFAETYKWNDSKDIYDSGYLKKDIRKISVKKRKGFTYLEIRKKGHNELFRVLKLTKDEKGDADYRDTFLLEVLKVEGK
ncbi:MAG: hypothetical protein ABI723_05655 [Bacteroidia bacterium]